MNIKRAIFEDLLSREHSVFVYLDPRSAEVSVPAEHKKNAVLILQIGLNLPVFIPLSVEDDRFVATLSFNRVPFECRVPWSVVFGIVGESHKTGAVFEKDVPAEVRAFQLRGFGAEDGLVAAPTTPATQSATDAAYQAHRDAVSGVADREQKKRTLPPGWGGVIQGGKREAS